MTSSYSFLDKSKILLELENLETFDKTNLTELN